MIRTVKGRNVFPLQESTREIVSLEKNVSAHPPVPTLLTEQMIWPVPFTFQITLETHKKVTTKQFFHDT